ncbi:MAG TPA: carboxypeptidase-like regulatory domain-containing protein, partial [Pyrinomonadaceae bacterium]|nr:carboxypeptidase-like regulatory domain-containing protein [Pyrinomonadaceae bacterium]
MKKFLMATLALCLFTVAALAQSNTGRLTGTVSDPSGVIPGATVTATNNATGKVDTATTTGEGTFTIPQLDSGTYTVKVTAPGHKSFTANDVKIDVSREYSLPAVLEVGNINENVTVVAGADVVNSTNAELSNTVSPRQIQELPLNGRNPLNLIALNAGTASNGSTNTSINGQRSSFTSITRDGINIQDNFIRANATDFAPERPSVDDTGEFTLTTQNAGAERGYGASQVELVTPSGGNEFHGAVFEYNRNSKFAANNFFNNLNGVKRPFLNRNQFGGRASGRIIRNKLFFFGYYEGLRLRQSSSRLNTVLTPNARNGVFTYTDNAGVVRTLNVLTAAGVAADATVASRLIANIPLGNSFDAGDSSASLLRNTQGFRFSQQGNTDRDSYTTRIDYNMSSRFSFNGVYSHKVENNLRNDVDATTGGTNQTLGASFGTTPQTTQPSTNNFYQVSFRATPTPRFTNEARGGIFKSDPIFNRGPALPDFFLNSALVSNPEVNFEQQGRRTKLFTFQDNAEYIMGNHDFRIGGQGQYYRITPFGPGAFGASTIPAFQLATGTATPALVSANFTGGISATQLTNANRLLALLGGIVSTGQLAFNSNNDPFSGLLPGVSPQRRLEFENYSTYFADSWRATPHLTLNLGVRYELYLPVREHNRLFIETIVPPGSSVQSAVLDPNGSYGLVGTNAGGKRLFKTDMNNFAPVLSFAWTPTGTSGISRFLFGNEGRTVIRGGYRISYVNDEFVRAADNAELGNAGLATTLTAVNPANGSTSLNSRVSTLNPTSFFPSSLAAPSFPRPFTTNNTAGFAFFGTAFAVDPNIKVASTHEYNIGIQREIGFQTALEIRYVGGRSNNLWRVTDFNQIDIRNNGFAADFNRARANLVTFGSAGCTAAQAAATGCQQLTVFPNLGSGGLLTNSTVVGQLQAGTPADLALVYIQNALTGTVRFLPNTSTGVADVLGNSGRYRYNSLQVEVRRRFSQGLLFQANYTFQKTLSDAAGVAQTRVDTLLDLQNPGLEYSRADYDQTHVFNLNLIYELPFGKGKRWLNDNAVVDRILGGWQVTNIIRT